MSAQQPDGGHMNRTCQNPECGKVLVRKRRESKTTFERRMYCGQTCANDAKSYAQRQQRGVCIVCGGETLPKRRPTGWRLPKTCLAPECVRRAKDVNLGKPRARPKRRAGITWTDPVGNTHILPSNIALREEYKASIKRRIKRGEGVAMIGNVRVYEGPVTRAAA